MSVSIVSHKIIVEKYGQPQLIAYTASDGTQIVDVGILLDQPRPCIQPKWKNPIKTYRENYGIDHTNCKFYVPLEKVHDWILENNDYFLTPLSDLELPLYAKHVTGIHTDLDVDRLLEIEKSIIESYKRDAIDKLKNDAEFKRQKSHLI